MSEPSSTSLDNQIALLERRLGREKKAREMAEQLLAEKSREIYAANQMLKGALLESEQKRDELHFLLNTSDSLSLGSNSEHLLTNVTELTCTFLQAMWGISAVQLSSSAIFDVNTPICDRNKHWSNNAAFIEHINAHIHAQPATHDWHIIDVHDPVLFPSQLKMMYCSMPIDNGSVLLSCFLLQFEPNSAETLDALTIIQRQLKTFLLARKNGTAVTETQDNLDIIKEQLSRAKTQLMQSEKMASLGQLAAGIAHEINNPVGYIRSNMEVMVDHVNDMHQFINACKVYIEQHDLIPNTDYQALHKQYDVDYILEDSTDIVSANLEGVDRISEIVNGLKTFSHQGESDFSALSIEQIVSAALNVVKNEIKYLHNVDHLIPDDDIMVMGKLGQLQQVFVNLFVNAAQAMPDGGTIGIHYIVDAKQCQINVTDTGAGMDEITRKQLFNPFFTTKAVGEGTGLGLSITYSIIESHKGYIDVASQQGQGTCFTITLPLAPNKSDV